MWIDDTLNRYGFEQMFVDGAYFKGLPNGKTIRAYVLDLSTVAGGECFVEFDGNVYRFDDMELNAYLKEICA